MCILSCMKRKLPTSCPSCQKELIAERLRCEDCGTGVEGAYPLPKLAALSQEDQEFVLRFIEASGSLKEMARLMRVSYPTVRNRLDEIIGRLGHKDEISEGESRET